MDPTDLLLTAVRATAVYFVLLFVVRLLGKREVGAITAIDLIVALMLGEVVDEIVFGDVSMVKGFLVIIVVAAWHFANSWVGFRSLRLDRLTEGVSTVLVEKGYLKGEALAAERMNEEELWSQLRLQGIEDLPEVKKATLEPSGHVSVLKQDWAKPVEKGDLQRLREGR